MSIIVRIARREDIPKIVSLHVRSWRENYSENISAKFLQSYEFELNRKEIWTARLSQENSKQYVVVAEKDGDFAGFICSYLDENDTLGTLIDNLHVEPKYHKNGVACRLMNSAAKWMQENRPEGPVYLEVFLKNTRAQKFYSNLSGTFTTAKPFEVKVVDGGKSLSYHVTWNSPLSIVKATRKKILSHEIIRRSSQEPQCNFFNSNRRNTTLRDEGSNEFNISSRL